MNDRGRFGHPRNQDRPRRVALLVGHLESEYTRTLISGAAERLLEASHTAVVFPAGVIGDDAGRLGRQFTYRPPLYALAGAPNCDGILCLSGTVSQLVDLPTFTSFLSQYAPLPVVSVAVPMPGMASIGIDGEAGIADAVRHLVVQHGRRRIAMLCGPESSGEAVRRFEGYRRAIEQHGIAMDPDLVGSGDWTRESGVSALSIILSKGKAFDAVIGANDAMASGAALVLWSRGISVPSDVSIVGFDDSDAARFAVPPLTTVRQPLHRLGFLAADMLLEQLAGSGGPREVVIRPKLVVRDSCGCFVDGVPTSRGQSLSASRPDAASSPSDESPISLLAEVLEGAGVIARDIPSALLESFEAECQGGFSGQFLAKIRAVIAQVPAIEATPWELRPIVAILRQTALSRLPRDPAVQTRAEGLLQDATILVGASALRAEARRRVTVEARARTLSHVGRGIDGTADLTELEDRLALALKRLHVRSCNVIRFDDPEHPTAGTRLLTRLGADDERRVATEGIAFSGGTVLPEGLALEHAPGLVVVHGLVEASRLLGYITLEVQREELSLASELADHVASALSRVGRERELARLHASERERSAELERATAELRANQEKLLISEKMAALGALTAGMAQEMELPLDAVRTSLGELRALVDRYEQKGASEGEGLAEDLDASIARAVTSAERVAGFVQGIKTQTRDLSRKEYTRFDAVSVVRDALLLLEHACRSAGCLVSFAPQGTSVDLVGSPGKLAQVVTNLVRNAIDASRPKGGGPVTVGLDWSGEELVLRVADQGVGIAQGDVARVVEPLFTTKRFGDGTGLGLAIAHNIVVADFGGSLAIESELGQGTRLTVRLPRAGSSSTSS